MPVVYVSGVCQWCMPVVYVSGVCQWCMSVVYVSGVCQWCMPVVHVSGVCQWCMSVVYASGVRQWTKVLANELIVYYLSYKQINVFTIMQLSSSVYTIIEYIYNIDFSD